MAEGRNIAVALQLSARHVHGAGYVDGEHQFRSTSTAAAGGPRQADEPRAIARNANWFMHGRRPMPPPARKTKAVGRGNAAAAAAIGGDAPVTAGPSPLTDSIARRPQTLSRPCRASPPGRPCPTTSCSRLRLKDLKAAHRRHLAGGLPGAALRRAGAARHPGHGRTPGSRTSGSAPTTRRASPFPSISPIRA